MVLAKSSNCVIRCKWKSVCGKLGVGVNVNPLDRRLNCSDDSERELRLCMHVSSGEGVPGLFLKNGRVSSVFLGG